MYGDHTIDRWAAVPAKLNQVCVENVVMVSILMVLFVLQKGIALNLVLLSPPNDQLEILFDTVRTTISNIGRNSQQSLCRRQNPSGLQSLGSPRTAIEFVSLDYNSNRSQSPRLLLGLLPPKVVKVSI